MTNNFGMPGPGGSLGKCAVCDGPFAVEVMMGKSVAPFTVGFLEVEMYCHVPACKTILTEAFVAAQNYEGETGDNVGAAQKLYDGLPEDGPLAHALKIWLDEQETEHGT